MKIAKYEFNSQAQAQEFIDALEPNNHTFVHLGNVCFKQPIYDEQRNEIESGLYSDKWSVDALWIGIETQPEGWSDFEIHLDDEGVHSFAGISYLENKM